MATQIQLRRGLAATWTSVDPTLVAGELGFETDTGKSKFGDGVTAWTSLAYRTPLVHAASHTDGSDDIQSATSGQKGLATAAQITKLDAIESLATADQTAGEIEAIVTHNNLLGVVAAEHISFTSGTAASRPAAGTSGRYYFATDTKILSRDNGSTWDTINSGGGGGDSEMFFGVSGTTTSVGDVASKNVGTSQSTEFSFCMPANFSSMTSLELIGIVSSGAAQTLRDIDFTSDYGAVGELATTHSESDTTSTYDLSTSSDEVYSFDISGVFSSLAAVDYCGLGVAHSGIGGNISYLGIRLIYTPT